MSAERERLLEFPLGRSPWRRWGPYLSERAWGTVREDYSAGGHAWEFFPHDHARSRAYRWNEDGLAGICDDRQTLCFALAFWNGADPIRQHRSIRPPRFRCAACSSNPTAPPGWPCTARTCSSSL